MNKKIFKKSKEELEQYLIFKKRHNVIRSKKGKGSFKRDKKIKEEEYE